MPMSMLQKKSRILVARGTSLQYCAMILAPDWDIVLQSTGSILFALSHECIPGFRLGKSLTRSEAGITLSHEYESKSGTEYLSDCETIGIQSVAF